MGWGQPRPHLTRRPEGAVLELTCISCLTFSGAEMKMKDRFGRNFLHLVVLQPKGLKNLSEDMLQVTFQTLTLVGTCRLSDKAVGGGGLPP